MTLWDLLFTNQKSAPPEFGLWYVFMPVSLIVIGYFSVKYAQSKSYQRFWYWAQLIQVLSINTWYMWAHMPLSDSLPFYHCRLAMLVILFAPKRTVVKQYFALLGVFGSIAALLYPVFDPFPFPHITALNLIFSHWALFANCLLYLQREYHPMRVTSWSICGITFGLNALIFLINSLTNGDYGFLRHPPLIGDQGPLLNYVIVSSVMSVAIVLVHVLWKSRFVEKNELSRLN